MTAKKVQDHEVADEAYRMWIDAGKPDGMAEDHWHRAKAKLEARDAFAEAPAKAAKPKAKAAPKAAAKAAATTVETTAPAKAPAKPRAKKPKAE